MKALLIERFGLRTHIESRELPLYDLVLARSDDGSHRMPQQQKLFTAVVTVSWVE